MKVTLHVPAVRLQVVAENVPAPPVLANETEPVGVVAPAPLVSATVAVHVEACAIGTVAGVQERVVLVVLNCPVTVAAALVLVA